MSCGLPVPLLNLYRCRQNVVQRIVHPFSVSRYGQSTMKPSLKTGLSFGLRSGVTLLVAYSAMESDESVGTHVFGTTGCSGRKVPRRCARRWHGTDLSTKINWMGFRCALDAENKTGTEGHSLLEYKLTGLIPDVRTVWSDDSIEGEKTSAWKKRGSLKRSLRLCSRAHRMRRLRQWTGIGARPIIYRWDRSIC